jgi:hypothetical protein
VFSHYGGYASPQSFVDGLTIATWVGAAVVGAGAVIALAIPRIRPSEERAEADLAYDAA